jgi:hypothetical protein
MRRRRPNRPVLDAGGAAALGMRAHRTAALRTVGGPLFRRRGFFLAPARTAPLPLGLAVAVSGQRLPLIVARRAVRGVGSLAVWPTRPTNTLRRMFVWR